ncbi:MAG: hypothetical protein GX083_03315 [Clostridiales bacterium]|nr:hypothetical protein [Clostridiales bacterium]
MNSQVKSSIEAKIKVFTDYFEVQSDVGSEMDSLIAKIKTLGDKAKDAEEFERLFAVELQDEYNDIFQKLTPRARPMTDEEKIQSKALAAELAYGTNDPMKIAAKIAGHAAMDAAESLAMELDSKARTAEREVMEEAGIYDEYQEITRKIEDVETAGNFIGRFFRNKK